MVPMTNSPKEALKAELEDTRSEFHRILDNLGENGWDKPSLNRTWTNGQVLFHMTLGFMLVSPLFWLIRFFTRIPGGYSKAFASLLNFFTPIFNAINGLGPKFAARAFTPASLGRKFDKTISSISGEIDSIRDSEWDLGMHYPTKWDPQMTEFITFEKLFRYPIIHFGHHAAQITMSRNPTANEISEPASKRKTRNSS